MAITGDRYVGTHAGHTIELVRNNWVKTVTLLIDGRPVARESCIWPHDITLTGRIERDGVSHTVVARSLVRAFFWADDSIEVDGQPLEMTKTK